MPHLHILTLTWNGSEKIKKLQESLYPCLKDIDFTWHIKDNDSKDNTEEIVSKLPNVNYIKYKNNLQNFSEGVNFLYKQANPKDNDFILLLNNDVVFNDTSSIKNMMSLFSNKDVGVVGARLLYTNTDQLQHAGVVFNDFKIGGPVHFKAHQKIDKMSEKNREFQAVTGAVLMTKSNLFKQANSNPSGTAGLCEKFVWAFDDVDFCLSVKYNLKKKIVYCGNTNIFHEESSSLKVNPVNKLFMQQNFKLLKERWAKNVRADIMKYQSDDKYKLFG